MLNEWKYFLIGLVRILRMNDFFPKNSTLKLLQSKNNSSNYKSYDGIKMFSTNQVTTVEIFPDHLSDQHTNTGMLKIVIACGSKKKLHRSINQYHRLKEVTYHLSSM